MSPPPSIDPKSADGGSAGCAVLLVLFIACVTGPLVSWVVGGPWLGAGTAIASVLICSLWVLRPAPGLVAGLLTTGIWLQGLGVLGLCAVRIARSLLS